MLIKPYDEPLVMAGQGTIGLEIAETLPEVDAAIVCCGGGGLVAGVATALSARKPSCSVWSAEPAAFDDTARSLTAGRRLANPPDAVSFCDAIVTPTPGELTFEINRRLLKGGLAVTDDEVADAMRAAFLSLKVVVEPGGAVALAAALSGKLDCRGRTTVVVLSGGNVDPDTYAAVLAGGSGAMALSAPA